MEIDFKTKQNLAMLHNYMLEVDTAFRTEPDKLDVMNIKDFDNIELCEEFLKIVGTTDILSFHAAHAVFVARMKFWMTTLYSSVYVYHVALRKALKEFPTESGEKEIAILRSQLQDYQDVLEGSSVHKELVAYAGLIGNPAIAQIKLTELDWNGITQ